MSDKCNMLKIPGYPAASGSSIFQYVSQHAFQAFLPQAFAQWKICHINWAAERAQTADSSLAAFHILYFFLFYFKFHTMDCDGCVLNLEYSPCISNFVILKLTFVIILGIIVPLYVEKILWLLQIMYLQNPTLRYLESLL